MQPLRVSAAAKCVTWGRPKQVEEMPLDAPGNVTESHFRTKNVSGDSFVA
jgi:hypothetical protein